MLATTPPENDELEKLSSTPTSTNSNSPSPSPSLTVNHSKVRTYFFLKLSTAHGMLCAYGLICFSLLRT